jgi:hypothetical protein
MAKMGNDDSERKPAAASPAASADDEAYDIRIAADGTWYYRGTPIERIGLVKLFARVLRRDEAGDYWLITPAERGRIVVDDAPFTAVEVTAEGEGAAQALSFRTNLDDWVTAGPDHPVRVDVKPGSGEPRPYIAVRDRLEALIVRPVFYELVERAVEHDGRVGIWSQNRFFALDPTG